MFIKSIAIQNYKCFGKKTTNISFKTPDGSNPGSGLNILVGENNSGKSTVFEAIDFFRNGIPKSKGVQDILNKSAQTGDIFSVEIAFQGYLRTIISNFAQDTKKAAFEEYIYNRDGIEQLNILRSSLKDKLFMLWDKKTNEYKNVSGIDAPIKRLFDIEFVWADTNPNDEAKFGASTVCGRLLKEVAKGLYSTEEYEEFQVAFNKVFHDEKSGIRAQLRAIEERVEHRFKELFGKAEIKFFIDEMTPDNYFKNTRIKVNDGFDTFFEEKGSGMQRALALALIQVYAENLSRVHDVSIEKPFYLLIDEPETCLHPQGQRLLLDALLRLSRETQIFIATHSPYFIDPRYIDHIIKFQLDDKLEIKLYKLYEESLKDEIKENRNFFFRHRDLFFARSAIFIEGPDDYERYSKYCETNNFNNIPPNFFIMIGCDKAFFFEKLCLEFGLNFFAIVDKDFSYNICRWDKKKFTKAIEEFKEFIKANGISFDDDSFDSAVNKEKEKFKYECRNAERETVEFEINGSIVDKVKDKNIFVLKRGKLEDYLDKNGAIFNDETEEKDRELNAIFRYISGKV